MWVVGMLNRGGEFHFYNYRNKRKAGWWCTRKSVWNSVPLKCVAVLWKTLTKISESHINLINYIQTFFHSFLFDFCIVGMMNGAELNNWSVHWQNTCQVKLFLLCLQNLHTVSFSKPGYMELSGLSLAVDTEISLSFSTLEDTGTILLAVGGGSPNKQKVIVILLGGFFLVHLFYSLSHSNTIYFLNLSWSSSSFCYSCKIFLMGGEQCNMESSFIWN